MSNTIEGFESLTSQQAFDLSASHILKTKQKSVRLDQSPNGGTPIQSCVYSGIGCAASVFLKDDETRAKCDNRAGKAGGSSWYALCGSGLVDPANAVLISLLQQAHDCVENDDDFLDCWKENMRNIANVNKLDASILDQYNGR